MKGAPHGSRSTKQPLPTRKNDEGSAMGVANTPVSPWSLERNPRVLTRNLAEKSSPPRSRTCECRRESKTSGKGRGVAHRSARHRWGFRCAGSTLRPQSNPALLHCLFTAQEQGRCGGCVAGRLLGRLLEFEVFRRPSAVLHLAHPHCPQRRTDESPQAAHPSPSTVR